MFMVTDTLKVGLLTDHVAVKDAPTAINPILIRTKVRIIEKSLKMDFGIQRPKIALLGINPHSGDHGVIGKEDEEVMKPVIKEMSDAGHLVFGPIRQIVFLVQMPIKTLMPYWRPIMTKALYLSRPCLLGMV